MQIDPIKPKLKPPGTKRLKPKLDELLSTSAFKFNLRRYGEVDALVTLLNYQVWRCRFDSIKTRV